MRHFMNRSVLFLIGIICASSLALTTLAQAETLVESSIFFRIYVAFSVDQKAVQAWLPAPWEAVSLPKGPLKGANLYVLLQDMLIHQDGEGKPDKGGTYCLAALIGFGKNQQTGEFAAFVTRVYAPYDGPGLYKTSVKATAYREATLKGSTSESGAGSEEWKVQDSAGGILEFRMAYGTAAPKRITKTIKPRSNVEPDLFHVFRDDSATFLVKSIPAGIDSLKDYKFKVTISELSKVFNGSEQLIGISVSPIYVRQQILP